MDAGWFRKAKHVFILSSSGKPIFCRHGDEQEFVTIFGLLQAVISIVQDSGDHLQCIRAGQRTIVYYTQQSLYYVNVSYTGEPEVVLRKQLEFMHSQILLVLTSRVHDILRANSSRDIRDLLGPETNQWLHCSCAADSDMVSPQLAFQAIKSLMMGAEARGSVQALVRECVESSGSA